MEDKRNFKGVWIPKEVWLDESLTITEKVLIIEIDSLDHSKEGGKGCFKSNENLGKFLNLSSKRIANILTDLKKRGYVEQIGFDGRIRYLSIPKFGKADTSDVRQQIPHIREHSNTESNTVININGKSEDLPSVQTVIDSNIKTISKCPKSVGGKQVSMEEVKTLVDMVGEYNLTRSVMMRVKKFRPAGYEGSLSFDGKACRQVIEIIRAGFTVEEFNDTVGQAFSDQFHEDNNYKYVTPEYISRMGMFEKYLELHQTEMAA